MPQLSAVALVCSLKPSPARSSSALLAQQFLDELAGHGVSGELIRVVDYDVKPGVTTDEGDGDEWPEIRKKVLAADILVLATPTWMGQHSSVCQRVLERFDAELSETDDQGRLLTSSKVAVAAVVGNEDGAHHITAVLYQCLNDVGFTIASQGGSYWNGEAMHTVDYQDLPNGSEQTSTATKGAAANAAHLAKLLSATPYPPQG
jgi:multimeric flavodoxin WrbA